MPVAQINKQKIRQKRKLSIKANSLDKQKAAVIAIHQYPYMNMNMIAIIISSLLLLGLLPTNVSGHGYLKTPRSRNLVACKFFCTIIIRKIFVDIYMPCKNNSHLH